MNRPKPINEEIPLDAKRYLVSETDAKGIITYANSYFIEISGYSEEELLHQPHSLIRHPDMPKVVFKLLWETIGRGDNINVVVKNLAKDGRYYWVFTEFKIKKDTDSGEIIGYMASRKAVSKHVVEIVSELYKTLLEIEQKSGVDAAQKYLEKFLKEKGDKISFASLMENIHKFY